MPAILQHFIGGQYRRSRGDDAFANVNPSDARDVIARVPVGVVADVDAAIAAAHAALPSWRRTPGPGRAEHLYRWSRVIGDRREELAQALSREVGKPITEARGEIGRCETILQYYAGEAVRPTGSVIPSQVAGALQFALREPVGVVGLVTPWNFPAAIPLWKAAPALAFGNTVVLKPAEVASHVAVLLTETVHAAGLPAGVFNTVLGAGDTVGAELVAADGIDAVSFTGSTAVGARVAAVCAARNARYQTEMGGKNVAIVLADADLDLAARLTAAGAMRYAGQKCTATSRVVVVRDVRDAFVQRLQQQIDELPLGPVEDAAAAVGPLISEAARNRVQAALTMNGAREVRGGRVPADARFAHGFFLTPALVLDPDEASPLVQDELFGPVLVVLTVSDLTEALTVANRTRYGLSASLFTRDLSAAMTYITDIQAGMVRINADTTGVDPHAPFGGMKASGSGTREQGPAAREFYTSIKTVQVNS